MHEEVNRSYANSKQKAVRTGVFDAQWKGRYGGGISQSCHVMPCYTPPHEIQSPFHHRFICLWPDSTGLTSADASFPGTVFTVACSVPVWPVLTETSKSCDCVCVCVWNARGLFHVLACGKCVFHFCLFHTPCGADPLWWCRKGHTVPAWSANGSPRSCYLGPSVWLMNDAFVVLDWKNAALSSSDEWAGEIFFFFF